MKISFVILTHNRRPDLLRTLGRLKENTNLPDDQWETIVVDNASTDGTADAVSAAFPGVRLIRRETNEGSFGRNHGAQAARGPYLIFLDDDSYPLNDTVRKSIKYLDDHPKTAMVGGRVILPDGTEDAAALPIILPACAMCVRRDAFLAVGGFDRIFFRQAEEYDLIFRLLAAGHQVERFEDLVYQHDKVQRSRNSSLIQEMDLRNNMILLHRYIPRDLRKIYRHDWLQRYSRMMHCGVARMSAISEARQICTSDPPRELSAAVIERIFEIEKQAREIATWAGEHRIRRALIADMTKNVYATWNGCSRAGLDVAGIAEESPKFGGSYRGIPVTTFDAISRTGTPFDGIVLSNINPARVERRLTALKQQFSVPILRLWHPKFLPYRTVALNLRAANDR